METNKETIKSVTNCPTCGAECKIGTGDGNSHYYIPIINKEIPTAEEFLTINDEKDFRLSNSGMYLSELLVEFAKLNRDFHLSKQAEVIVKNGWTKRDVGQLGEDIKIALRKNKLSTPELYLIIDECVKNLIKYREQSILQAHDEYIKSINL